MEWYSEVAEIGVPHGMMVWSDKEWREEAKIGVE